MGIAEAFVAIVLTVFQIYFYAIISAVSIFGGAALGFWCANRALDEINLFFAKIKGGH